MNISRIQQTMLKHAADYKQQNIPGSYEPGRGFKLDSDYADQTKVYTSVPPGGAIGTTTLPAWTNDSRRQKYMDAYSAGYDSARDRRDPKSIGAFWHYAKYNPNGTEPTVEWKFPVPGTNDWYSSGTHSIKTYPRRLPGYRAGQKLLEYSRQAIGNADPGIEENNDRIPFTTQPLNEEQIYETETNDPFYLDRLLTHYRRIPKEYWDRANLQLSSPEEIRQWRKYVPPLATTNEDTGGVYYSPRSGVINVSPTGLNDRLSFNWGNADDEGQYRIASESYAYRTNTPATYPGKLSQVYFHENRHQNTIGKRDSFWGPSGWRHKNVYFNPNLPVSSSNIPAMMRLININPIMFTDKQLGWVGEHAVEPYALDEDEVHQALMALNAGRYALKRDMLMNPDNPNYTQLKPEVRQQFMSLPDFIAPGEEGRQQMDSMMQFFTDNPEFRVLMPGQFNSVGHYQNLKAAIDTAKTPEEKQYFQNLMDKMIYNKSFLANNQQRPNIQSYADYRQMYA